MSVSRAQIEKIEKGCNKMFDMSNYPESIAEEEKLRDAYSDLRRYTLLAHGTSQSNEVK